MKLHLLRGDLDFHWLQPAGGVMWKHQGGTPVVRPWRVPRLVLPVAEPADEFLPVDCLPMNTGCDGPIVSEFAREALADLLAPGGEFWPVDVLGRRYWWYNCCVSVAALDPDGTDAEWGSVEGEQGPFRWIMTPRQLAFLPARVAVAPAVFRVPEFPFGALFAQDRVKRAISRHKLTGFRLDLVWSSSAGGVQNPAGFDFDDAWQPLSFHKVERKRANARAVLQNRNEQAG